jgi:diacylglycerol kinase family enzyme
MDAVIEVDGEVVFKGEIFSMNVGICKYNGGGMMQVPFAIPDDGLMDVTLIRKAPKYVVIQHARKLYDGSLVNLPIVKTFRGKQIRIRSTGRIYLETDGESLGHTPFTFEIIPLGIRTVVG